MSKRFKVTVHPPRTGSRERNLRLRIRGPEGVDKSRSSGTTDQVLAELEAERLALELNAGLGDEGLANVLDVLALRVADLESDPRRAPSTVKAFRQTLKKLKPYLDGVPVAGLRPGVIRSARDKLVREPMAAKTANNYVQMLKAAWRWAEERELILTPFPRVARLREKPTEKRPYSPVEVMEVLEWLRQQEAEWLPLFTVLADTGLRIGGLCSAKGDALDRARRTLRVFSKGEWHAVPLTAEALSLLPELADAGAYLFPSRDRWGNVNPKRHLQARSALHVLRRALKALGIVDGARLDLHSFRRAEVTHLERAGVPTDVGRRVTKHATRAMFDRYMRNAEGDDLHAVVELVREQRVAEWQRTREPGGSLPKPPQNGPPSGPAEGSVPAALERVSHELVSHSGDPARDLELAREGRVGEEGGASDPGSTPLCQRAAACGPVEASRAPSQGVVHRRDVLWGRLDPDLATVARWADEDPAAMLRLLGDEGLRAHLATALQDLCAEVEGDAPEAGASSGT